MITNKTDMLCPSCHTYSIYSLKPIAPKSIFKFKCYNCGMYYSGSDDDLIKLGSENGTRRGEIREFYKGLSYDEKKFLREIIVMDGLNEMLKEEKENG